MFKKYKPKKEKINNYIDALKYIHDHKNGTMDDLKENLTDEIIKQLSLTGYINI